MVRKRSSIRRKFTTAILLVSGVALLLTTFSFILYEITSYKEGLTQNLATLAKVVAANSSGSLAFGDEKDARQVLAGLRGEPHIVVAALYDGNGKLFASYPTNLPSTAFPESPGDSGPKFVGNFLSTYEPVRETGSQLGTLFLKSDLISLDERVRSYALIAAGVLAASLLAAWLMSIQLQRRISAPILTLAATAEFISNKRDYSVRAPKLSEDEIGQLTDSFNQMLARIQEGNSALFETAERLRIALEASQTGTWDWDIQRNRFFGDDSLYRLLGISAEAFGGTREDFEALIHAEDRPLVREMFEHSVRTRKDLHIEYRVHWPDQTLHRIVSRGRAFYEPAGKALRMTGVSADVTESRKAEEAERFLAAIVATTDDAIIGKNLEGKVVSWNSGAEKMFGFTKAEMLGLRIDALLPPVQLTEERRGMEQVRQGVIVQVETLRRKKSGVLMDVSITLSPIRNAHGQIIGASSICRDITKRKQAEDENKRLKSELEQRVQERTAELGLANHQLAVANQELEAFTSSVAHDLRAPLRHMDAYAHMLLSDFASQVTPEMQTYLERIIRSSQNMGHLVDDLLNLARVGRQEVKRQMTDLGAVMVEVVKDLTEETKNRKIDWQIGKLPLVECDPGLVKQLLANLASNAVKYSRPRSMAVIEVDSFEKQGERVLFIRDNGVGFSMKHAHKLFGIFQRLHRSEDFEGTGVGLATVERIVRKHQGRIWAEAELDKGATFYFTLAPAKAQNLLDSEKI